MSPPGHRKGDEALFQALACGATVENAARKAGLSPRTAYRRLAEPGFRRRLTELRNEMVERAMSMLTAASLEAVKTLVSLQETSQPAAVRLGAARSIIEYGLKLREVTEMAERITALEEQLGTAA
jgi:hypothetical protein